MTATPHHKEAKMIVRLVATYRGMVAQEARFEFSDFLAQHATMQLNPAAFIEVDGNLGGPPAEPMPIRVRVEITP